MVWCLSKSYTHNNIVKINLLKKKEKRKRKKKKTKEYKGTARD
jgi:hypothetical protein